MTTNSTTTQLRRHQATHRAIDFARQYVDPEAAAAMLEEQGFEERVARHALRQVFGYDVLAEDAADDAADDAQWDAFTPPRERHAWMD